MAEEEPHRLGPGAKGDEEKPAGQGEVLQEIPEQAAPLAVAARPEIAGTPELLPQQRRDAAIAREHEGGGSVGDAGEDAQRHHDLDEQAREDQNPGEARVRDALACLSHRAAEVQDLVQGAEGQEQQHQEEPDREGDGDAEFCHGPVLLNWDAAGGDGAIRIAGPRDRDASGG